jgi:hypothetical protein
MPGRTTMKLLHLLVDTLFFWNRNDNVRNVVQYGRVIGLRLVRAPSGRVVVANLVNGTTIHLNGTEPQLTIVAVTSASIAPLWQGVQFNMDSPKNHTAAVMVKHIDRVAPYTLCGGGSGAGGDDDYQSCSTLRVGGTHTLTAMALHHKLPYTVSFTLATDPGWPRPICDADNPAHPHHFHRGRAPFPPFIPSRPAPR